MCFKFYFIIFLTLNGNLLQTFSLDIASPVVNRQTDVDTSKAQGSNEENNNFSSSPDVLQFLREFDREASESCNRIANAKWKFITNSTEYNRRRMHEQETIASKFNCISWKRASVLNSTRTISLIDRRQFERILKPGHCGLGEVKFLELSHILTLMSDKYKTARICPYVENRINSLSLTSPSLSSLEVHDESVINSNYGELVIETEQPPENYVHASTTYCNLKLDPDIKNIFQYSRSETELLYVWRAWHDIVGPPIRNTFMRYLDLVNQAARIHGFKDAGDQMRSVYEDPEFYFTVDDLWTKIKPLYKQLFTFVRRGLIKFYGTSDVLRQDGPIPAHLFGDVWAENWINIIDLVKPGDTEIPSITNEMIRQGYTPLRMFQATENFFTSLGLPPMLPEFWRNSLYQNHNDTNAFRQCDSSALDFCNSIDFRISQCTQVSFEDFMAIHHEMAYIQYFMHYAGQPYVFQNGPTPAFQEAVANAIELCVSGPVYMKKVGLLSKTIEVESGNSKLNIEFLLRKALEKLPLISYSLMLEKWRWNVFEKGPIGMNRRWWELHLKYMGVIPPIPRVNNDLFDAAINHQLISDQDHIKHFIGTILEFQIFAELCHAANHVGPLHTCDFYRSRSSGRILMDVMQKGASFPMDQLIKVMTRNKTAKISADSLLEYFRPLEAWLEIQNRNEEIIGWNSNLNDVALYQPLNNGYRFNDNFTPFFVMQLHLVYLYLCYIS